MTPHRLTSTHSPSVRRILMTTDTVGGVWSYSLELVRALESSGVHILLATMGKPLSQQQRSEVLWLDNVEIRESEYKLEWMDDPWEDVDRAADWLLELEEIAKPDVIHLNGYTHGCLPWRTPTLMVGHSCVFSWFEAVKGETPPAAWHRYYEGVRAGLFAAGRVTAPTLTMLQALKKHYGDFNATDPIYNGRRFDRFFYRHRKTPLILTAGRVWDEAKNIAVLDEIAPRLSWPVYVAGEARHPDGGTAELVHARPLGHLSPSKLAEWYSYAPIFVLPARYEPFGLTALEAALSGCALVLGNIPSLRELWSGAALFVSPDEPERIQQALEMLIQNPALRRTLAKKAAKRARSFTPDRMARQYMKQYRELCSTRSPDTAQSASDNDNFNSGA